MELDKMPEVETYIAHPDPNITIKLYRHPSQELVLVLEMTEGVDGSKQSD